MSVQPDSLPPSSLTALTQAAAAINSTLDLDAVLTTIARLASSVTRGAASRVFLLDSHRKAMFVAAATGLGHEAMAGREFDAQGGVPGAVLRSGAPLILVDVQSSRNFSKEIDGLGSARATTLIAAPMIHRAEVIGVIEVVNRHDEREFTEGDLKILQVFAALAAGATQNARVHTDLRQRFDGLRDSVMRRTSIIGESTVWQRVMDLCDRVARSSATALLLGETGTGKELLARYIHNQSKRSNETFVAVNCAALPETLLESELFGHEKGSFTGAHARRLGWFEVASRGTLFLDEIGEVTRAMQAKLLRVLQEKRIVRVGGTQPIPCETRIIAATNRNLKNMMIDGLFRDDLYYRLSVFPIPLPALRERREDIVRFVEYIVPLAARECSIRELRVAPETMEILTTYDWPGNIRELQNVIERAVLMSDGPTLWPAHLPPDIVAAAKPNEPGQDRSTLFGQERALIVEALEEHNWNQSRAAVALGVSRYHLRHRIKKYGIERPSSPSVST